MKKGFFTLCTALVFFTGCEKETAPPPSNGKALRVHLMHSPETLDPRKAASITDVNLTKMFMEGLTRIGKSGKAELALAERYSTSEDKKTYRFVLKKAKWSNGVPITAHDFVYSWKTTLAPDFPARMAEQLYVIKNGKKVKEGTLPNSMLGVKALDDRTLVVNLEQSVPYFLEFLALPWFFPVNQEVDTKEPAWATQCAKYVNNGPFTPEQWQPHSLIEARRNDLYWDTKHVKVGQLKLMIGDPATGLAMFENNEIDWSGSPMSVLPNDAIPALKKKNQLQVSPFLTTVLIRTNLTHPALKSAKVRKALALAINRQQISEHVLQGGNVPALELVPNSLGISENNHFSDGNVTLAKKLLEEAIATGEVQREDLNNLTLIHAYADNAMGKAQEAIQQQWHEALGIRVQLQKVDRQVFYDRVRKSDFDFATGIWIADFNDAINFLNVFKTRLTPTNNTYWENAEYIAHLDASDKAFNEQKRVHALKESEKILMKEMPIIPLFHSNMLYVKKDNVKDVILTTTGTMDVKWASIE